MPVKQSVLTGLGKHCAHVASVREVFFSGSPKISDFGGEQRPWSPADLVERYRLCDPSAECEVPLFPARCSAAVERPQGYFVLFVGRRYYLRPIILWNALRPLEQSLWLYLERPQGVSKKPLLHTRYTRNRGGNVEQSWCFRGERFSFRGPRKSRIFGESRGLGRPLIKWSGISHCDPSAECECKITTFF